MEPSTSEDQLAAGFIIDERDSRHVLTRILQFVLKPLKPRLMQAKKLPDDATRLTATRRCRRHCQITEREIDGVWIYELRKRRRSDREQDASESSPPRQRILYYAGGGWQMPPSDHHWAFCTELVRRLENTCVTLVSYPLAPKAPVSVAFPRIEKVYKELLLESTKAGESLVVAGDSSGGNIALCVVTWTLRFQDSQPAKPPVAVLVISPTTDLRHDMEAIKRVDKHDPIHTYQSILDTAKAWCPGPVSPERGQVDDDDKDNDYDGSPAARTKGVADGADWGFEDPRVSPIQADLSYLVRHGVSVHGVTGSYDVLEPEAIAFRDKCQRRGVAGHWLSWHGQMHCFPLTFRYKLKEGREGLEWIIRLLRQQQSHTTHTLEQLK